MARARGPHISGGQSRIPGGLSLFLLRGSKQMWLPRNQMMQSQLKGTGQAPVPYKVDEASHRSKRPNGPDAATQPNRGQAPPPHKAKEASSTQCWRTQAPRARKGRQCSEKLNYKI